MSRWIYVWELGAGQGHLARMRCVSEALTRAGEQVHWYVPEAFLSPASAFWPSVEAAPRCRPRPSVARPGSFAEILQNEGWSDAVVLARWRAAWQPRLEAADRVLLDFAPNALLAALFLERPVTVVGTGFYLPPKRQPMPAFRTDIGVYPDRLRQAEQRVTEAVSRELPLEGCLAGLFHAARVDTRLATVPDLDHYGDRGGGSYQGVVSAGAGSNTTWRAAAGERVFAYLKPFPRLPAILGIADRLAGEVQVHGDAEVARVVQALDLPRTRFVAEPVDERSLEGAVLIQHAGHDGTFKALRAGVPLLQIPLNMEQAITAVNAERTGGSVWLAVDGLGRFEACLAGLLAEIDARSAAARTWGLAQPDPETALADLVGRLLD